MSLALQKQVDRSEMSEATTDWLIHFVQQECSNTAIVHQAGSELNTLADPLGDPEIARIVGELLQQGVPIAQFVAQWCEATLLLAETAPDRAHRCLFLAKAIVQQTGQNPTTQALLDYVQARIYVQVGELAEAEQALQRSQTYWQAAGEDVGLARTLLGLTQVLALQGRYGEAEEVVQRAIVRLEALYQQQQGTSERCDTTLHLYAAHHNMATLLLCQDRHMEALHEYECNLQRLEQMAQVLTSVNDLRTTDLRTNEYLGKIHLYTAHLHLNRGTTLLLLDQPDVAEEAFHQAERIFEQAGELHHLGNLLTNLGALYLRTGRYAEALRTFEQASLHLLGVSAVDAVINLEHLYQAQQLPIDLANTYLALNLLREAETLLARSVALFRAAKQPADLGQSLYTTGLVQMRMGDWQASQTFLEEALQIFDALQNRFWCNRTWVALASLAYQQGNMTKAAAHLDSLPARKTEESDHWTMDAISDFEAQLLHVRLALASGHLDAAKEIVQALLAQRAQPMPHSQWRLHHLLGQIALQEGARQRGRTHLLEAIHLLERQRSTLPIEEIRLTFLDDKTEVYADLVAALLEPQPASEQIEDAISQADLAEAFATVERARSRTLLERLLAALPDESQTSENARDNEARSEARRHLHWLYNQLIQAQSSAVADSDVGEAGGKLLEARVARPSPLATRYFRSAEVSAELWAQEAVSRNLTWQQTQASPDLRAQVQPVDLATFQQALAPDQQAIVYSSMGTELFAFVVERSSVQLFRNLCSLKQLDEMLAEWRFQFGRAELGYGYVLRQGDHLLQRIRACLHDLYRFLLAPIEKGPTAPHRLVIPHKGLHALPFHALWDGEAYSLTRCQWHYSPSASIAVYLQDRNPMAGTSQADLTFAGLAINDPSIPAARSEVELAAQRFRHATLYLDQEANRQGLREAAANADILHLATHGLFRPDNPFFSVLKLADGWIDVRELYQLPLRARLVILSACESGVVQARGGDEVIGLARGFLGAGARQLIASLWNVHDASAATLLNRFYEYFLLDRGRLAVDALRKAQLDAVSAALHPYFWAPFYTIGG